MSLAKGTRLHDLQASLPIEYRQYSLLRDRLLNAVRYVDCCRLANHKPAATVRKVIPDLHSSISQVGAKRTQTSVPVAFIADLCYHNSNNYPRSSVKKCFVCERDGCWSTKHTPQERIRALRKIRRIRQLVTDLIDDDTPSDTDEGPANVFDEVVIHMQTKTDSGVPDGSSQSKPEQAPSATEPFATFKCTVLHSATVHATTERIPRIANPKDFDGLIIDTGAARASSGSITQFNAFCAFT